MGGSTVIYLHGYEVAGLEAGSVGAIPLSVYTRASNDLKEVLL